MMGVKLEEMTATPKPPNPAQPPIVEVRLTNGFIYWLNAGGAAFVGALIIATILGPVLFCVAVVFMALF